ncbi:MAG: methionine/alanine import family NSS transporter small subunit [Actinomycetaceae bacterium]|nr:methionine/alanine import family NSS transporter small subunit [Arcanobacterium sp.]MDD7505492.1 methionine/alanine import family NSS transporter small subunit [Actinomycetaceae bacterium]MDY6143473.1 methionine/alanine import family NSS transporter small subunit [Arcanobacterium sp.]
MTTSAIALLVVSVGMIWGGLAASVVYLVTHPMHDDD